MPNHASRIRGRSGARLAVAAAIVLATAAFVGTAAGSRQSGSTTRSFTFALSDAPVSMDIYGEGNVVSAVKIISLVTEPLERMTPSGKPLPNLAVSLSYRNGTTFTYQIRRGVRFSDGSPLQAADVAWSLGHLTDPKSKVAGTNGVPTVAVSGPRSVTVKYAKWAPTLRTELDNVSFVQEAKFGEAHLADLGTASALPIGTGPYKFQSWTSEGITLVRNPYYWGKKPAVDRLFFPTVPQDTSAQLAMRSGSIQAAQVQDYTSTAAWKGVPGVTLVQQANLTSNLLSFDTSKPPFNDLHVRKAVAYSLDRRGVMAAGLGGYGALLKALVPPGELADIAPSAKALTQFLNSLPQYDYDPAKAKAELAKSTYPSGFTTTIPYMASPSWGQLAVANLQRNMEPLGVHINPQVISGQQWGGALFGHKMTGINVLPGFGATVPDPNSVVATLVDPNLNRPVGDIANWTPTAVVQARPYLLAGKTKAIRWNAAKTILKAIADEVPYDPLFSVNQIYALAKGYRFTKAMSVFDFTNGDWIFYLQAT